MKKKIQLISVKPSVTDKQTNIKKTESLLKNLKKHGKICRTFD